MIISMNLILSFFFIFMNHPMSLGLILLIQTILISLISGFYSLNFWFSYILFLIMVGGMLILFMYMTSLASNEKFKFSKPNLFMFMILIMIMFLIYLNDLLPLTLIFNNNNMMENINNLILLKNENLNSLNFIYNKPNFFLTILLIIYLLITLIAIVKITKFNIGPLRQKF
uniref:NADH-ubiquinone oxidoreductase chain 6 n=2 Tax=unclassified Desmopachria TaxID=2640228 RepID=A0A873QKB4_9DYTI|nr:NADH dehydrogenase subunit 6 [Desmopachria sp. ITV9392]QPA36194.1 NADH dehydrogenase subunit 6 [Desmopachria sp. RRMO-2020]QPA36207.1 NADH dehydrogenase subunit 6 [Desmopachria sp. RRMO-2020]QPA36220.1 NADH dehydrogenase subunit 6 [Desmopachria sp. RRMO-2020]QPA36233.1 NADH dehydrogenase subunit 6 [Desmopachria sp. RRMO-2020]